MRSWFTFVIIVSVTIVFGCDMDAEQGGAVKVEVVRTEDGYRLFRGGEPYVVKGAGMAVDDLDRFASHGGNSIRNWTTTNTNQDTLELLDAAQARGVTVALCLSMTAERHGFDYGDEEAVARQLAAFREEVLKYRDHPALLFWIIGNELNHSYTDSRVYDAVNDVARMIHEVDPNHPTTTTVAGFEDHVISDITSRAPEIDFISFQLYGELFGLPERAQEFEFRQPFMVTEWGAIGYWEMELTTWGTPTEMTSSGKADTFLRAHEEILASFDGQLLGSYVFLWGQKQERTSTWFGMFTEDGEETEVVDVMHYLWNGAWPENRTPRVNSMLLDGKTAKQSVVLAPGETYQAVLEVVDKDGDELTYRWEVKPESDSAHTGGDYEEPIPNLDGLLTDSAAAVASLSVTEPGKYRLYAYAYDNHGHAAHANIPFRVESISD